MKLARTILPAFILLALTVMLACLPALGQVPNAPSWFGDAQTRRHFVFAGGAPTEVAGDPWGSGFTAGVSIGVTPEGWTDTVLSVENQANPDQVKHVWLQYSWLESGPGGIADPMNQNLHGSTGGWSPPTSVTEDLGGGLFRRTIEWTIIPQPAHESFEWWTSGGFSLVDVSVATICTPAPEPSSIATLLASGLAAGVFALRRRGR